MHTGIRNSMFTAAVVFFSLTADAQVRKYSNEFLSLGVGGRGMAMSGAQAAITDDVHSGYWNPAGLAKIEDDFQLSFMHAEYFAGIAKYDYLSLAVPLKGREKFVGLSVLRFGVDDIPNTLFLIEPDGSVNYDNITSFSVADYAVLLSYAQKMKVEGLNLGGNVKIVHRKAGSFATAWGFGLDLGAQYEKKNVKIGLMAKDITSTFNAWSFNFTEEEKEVLTLTGNDLPENSVEITVPKIILGLAYDYTIKEKFTILPSIDFDFTTDGQRNVLISSKSFNIDPHFGLELDYLDIIYLRTGIGNIQKATDDNGEKITTIQPNLGIGLKIKAVSIDYAYTDIGNQSEALYSHVFSINLNVNKKGAPK